MKTTIKKFSAVLLGMVAISGSAFASEAYYGMPKTPQGNKVAGRQSDAQVVLHNYTGYTYMAHAVFQPSHKISNLRVGVYGSGFDVITYDIDYRTDNQVCLTIIREFDGAQVFPGPQDNPCLYYGNVSIGPYLAAAKEGDKKMLPPIKVTP